MPKQKKTTTKTKKTTKKTAKATPKKKATTTKKKTPAAKASPPVQPVEPKMTEPKKVPPKTSKPKLVVKKQSTTSSVQTPLLMPRSSAPSQNSGSQPALPDPSMERMSSANMKSSKKQGKFFANSLVSLYLAAALMVLVFLFGFASGRIATEQMYDGTAPSNVTYSGVPENISDDIDFRLFWQVWQYVKSNYVQTDVQDIDLFHGALSGMVGALGDPYSVFFEPKIAEEFTQELSGNFEGIGAEIGIKQNQLQIIAPLPGNPAEEAGLRAGDFILAIDQEVTQGMPLDLAVSKIRGEKGTDVVLTIFSEGNEEPRDVTITRDTIEIDSVRWEELDGDIAYVEVLYFNENTLADWNGTIQEMLASNPSGIILDLRNNPGGFLSTAIEIAGDWVNGNTVVIEQSRGGQQIGHNARRRPQLAGIPTVVLVNYGSASGSEIVAGALQDYGVATIIGEQTFGKGSVQDLREFSDGSSVKLTIAEWLTPEARNINHEGITPDIEVELTREDYEADLDPQLDRAVEFLSEGQ